MERRTSWNSTTQPRSPKRLASACFSILLCVSLLLASGCRTEQEVLKSEGLDGADGYETESQSEIMLDQGVEEEAYH